MTSTKSMNSTATKRLKQDYMRLKKDPVPYVDAEPLPSNILEWHYVVRGPDDSPYKGGMYHGKLVFPRDFPFKPPSIYMITPNGRFRCNTRLCLSISDFHPDTWNPAWSVSTILTGLLSFMLETTPTLGSIQSSVATKRQYAMASWDTNMKNATFCELFPEVVEEIQAQKQKEEEAAKLKKKSLDSATPDTTPSNWIEGRLFGGQAGAGRGEAGAAGNDGDAIFHTLSSVMLVLCTIAFVWSVKYVLSSLVEP